MFVAYTGTAIVSFASWGNVHALTICVAHVRFDAALAPSPAPAEATMLAATSTPTPKNRQVRIIEGYDDTEVKTGRYARID
jgi:hypothetical protein